MPMGILAFIYDIPMHMHQSGQISAYGATEGDVWSATLVGPKRGLIGYTLRYSL